MTAWLTTNELRSAWAPACKGPLARVALYGGAKVSIRPAIVDAARALSACLEAFSYEATPPDCGAYNCRPITGGTKPSLHAYGIAIDLNWLANPYGSKLRTDMPPAMVAAIKAIRTNSGAQIWGWGGDYSGNKDAMHFEIRCSPEHIASGINWSTVHGKTAPSAGGRFVQAMLNLLRGHTGKSAIVVDGNLGSNQSKAAIAEFQRDYNAAFHPRPPLAVDGAAGPATCRAIGFCVRLLPR